MKDQTRSDLDNFIDHGCKPSGFLMALLSNDLVESFRLADEDNLRDIYEIVRFAHNNIPAGAWGSPDKVDGWIKNRGKEQYQRLV